MKSPVAKGALILVLILFVVGWQNWAVRRGGGGPSGIISSVFSPAQQGSGAAGTYFGDVWRVLIHRGSLVRENEELRYRLADVEGQNSRLLRYRRENDELRGLLKIAPPAGGTGVAAEIVSFDATDYAQRVTLNIGSRRGVKPKDVVYCAYGLVGQVITVSPFTCTVILLTDRESGVGAMTSRTAAKGVVLGSGSRICKFTYLDFGADVREGDLVVTSGLIEGRGGIYPKGMVIGKVIKVERDTTYSRLDAYVDPIVPFDRLTAVFVRVGAG
jgi:rod shape-determining protein MreC